MERHEDAIAILVVGAERPAFPEANTAVQRVRRLERRVAAGFEEQLSIPALASDLEDVTEQCSRGTASS
jgi:hypothetical protein